ncbi:Ankyrin repeat-containing protein [Entamoeba marina]
MSSEISIISSFLEKILCEKDSIHVIQKLCEIHQSNGTSFSFIHNLLSFLEANGKTLPFLNEIFDQWACSNDNLLFIVRKNYWSYNCFTTYLLCSDMVEFMQSNFEPFFATLHSPVEAIKEQLKPTDSKDSKSKELKQNIIESKEVTDCGIQIDLSHLSLHQLRALFEFIITKIELLINALIDNARGFPEQIGYVFHLLRRKLVNSYVNTINPFLLYLLFESVVFPFLLNPIFYGMIEETTPKQLHIISFCIYILKNIALNTQIQSGYLSLFNQFISYSHNRLVYLFLNKICSNFKGMSRYSVSDADFERVCKRLAKSFSTTNTSFEEYLQKASFIVPLEAIHKLKEMNISKEKRIKEPSKKTMDKIAPFQYFGWKYEQLEKIHMKSFRSYSAKSLLGVQSKKVGHIMKLFNQNESLINYSEPKTGQTPIMMACKNQEKEVFSSLLLKNPNLFCKDFRGWSVAHHAIYEKRTELVQLLMTVSHLVLFDSNDDLNTPLHYLVQLPFTEQLECCILFCLRNGANVNSVNISGETPLLRAIKKKNSSVVKLLLSLGADPFLQCFGKSAYEFVMLDLANLEIKQVVMDFTKTNSYLDYDFVHISNANIELNFSKPCHTSFFKVYQEIKRNNALMFKYLFKQTNLLDNNATLANGSSLLHEICRVGNAEILQIDTSLLVVKINKLGETPLMVAINCNNAECALILLSSQINNLTETTHPKTGRNALHYACASNISLEIKKGNVELTELLLNNGADLFIENKNQQICTQIAYENKDPNNFHYLFEHEFEPCDDELDFYYTIYTQDLVLLITHVLNFLNTVTIVDSVSKWEIVLKIKRLFDNSNLFPQSEIHQPPNEEIKSFIQWLAVKYEFETLRNQMKESFMQVSVDPKFDDQGDEDAFELIKKGLEIGIQNRDILQISIQMLEENLSRCMTLLHSLSSRDHQFDPSHLNRLVKKLYLCIQQTNAHYYAN